MSATAQTFGGYSLQRFVLDVLTDALNDASVIYWRRRAAELDAARPRLGDFTGRATAAEIQACDRRLAGAALACREKAAMLEAGWFDSAEDDVAGFFGEAT